MKNKLTLSMFLSLLLCMNLSAQMTKSINPPNEVFVQPRTTLLDIIPNVTEDFESYPDFTTDFAPWILTDVDQTPTYGIEGVSFPNSGSAMAYLIFNPNNTTPSQGGNAEMAAHSGEKFAACFNSIPSQGSTNNDWMISPTLDMGINSQLSFFGKSYTVSYGNEKLRVLVSTSGTDPSDFTEISNGIISLPEDWTEYTLDLAQYNNQSIHIAFQCVSEDAFILMLDDILVSTEENSGGSNLMGLVTNALDGTPIAGALVSVADLTAYTDAQGQYSISGVPEGVLTANFMGTPTSGDSPLTVQFSDLSTNNTQLVTCSATDYITYNNNQVVIPPSGDITLNISLSPTISGDGMRFVLNWGADPRDLDSHIRTPEIEGTTYHVYYNSQGSAESVPYVALDHDVTQGFGPETTTIYQFFNGVYHFYIYKFAGAGEITTSNAVVQIYDENGLLQTIQAPASGTGNYWYVGTVNGNTQTFNIINTIQETEPGTGKSNVEYPPKPEENSRQIEITSWNWDFGDGQTSSTQSPSHVYQNGGDYTVTLTVSDGTNTNTEEKQSYIHVEGSQGASTLSGMVTNALDGTPIAGALVNVANLSAYTDAQGNYIIENVPEGSLTANFMASSTEGGNPFSVQFSDLSTSNTQLVTCSATDFITYNNNQVVIPSDGAVTLNISLSPNISGAGIRFVLNWGANPRDLDSHIRTPEIEGTTYHVYYSSQGSVESAPYVALDHDVTQGFGPETTTIYQFFNGVYHFYIYKFSGSGEITSSNAVVQIYNEHGLLQTLQAPTTGTGNYWYIGTINGNNQTVHIINTIQDTEPGTGKKDVEYPAKQYVENNQWRDIVSWNWDFGDGQSSALQNPSHTYTNDGNYTVSLVISDGNISNTETKMEYIHVSAGFSIHELNSDMINLYPNPSDGLIQINSEIRIDKIRIYNNSGKLVLDKIIDDKAIKLDIKYLPSGIYIMQAYSEKGLITKKVAVK